MVDYKKLEAELWEAKTREIRTLARASSWLITGVVIQLAVILVNAGVTTYQLHKRLTEPSKLKAEKEPEEGERR